MSRSPGPVCAGRSAGLPAITPLHSYALFTILAGQASIARRLASVSLLLLPRLLLFVVALPSTALNVESLRDLRYSIAQRPTPLTLFSWRAVVCHKLSNSSTWPVRDTPANPQSLSNTINDSMFLCDDV